MGGSVVVAGICVGSELGRSKEGILEYDLDDLDGKSCSRGEKIRSGAKWRSGNRI